MKLLLLLSILCVTAQACIVADASAQSTNGAHTALVVKPDGTSQLYEPMRPRVFVKHDTVERTVILRDTVTHDSITREVYHIDTGRVSVSITLHQAAPARAISQTVHELSCFGVYGYADFHGAVVAPGLSLDLAIIRFWLYAGARYQSADHQTYFTAGVSAFAPLISR